jgi:tRNA-intron endonuclease
MRRGRLAAVGDGDVDVSYYSISSSLPPGPGPVEHAGLAPGPGEAEEVPGGGLLSFSGSLKDRGEKEGLGTDLNGIKAFSIEESSYLTGKVGSGEMDLIKDTVYRDLRARGYLIRTGFKYGSHFRVYSSGSIEEHSDLLVHCVKPGDEFTWEQLARAIRLSHSVRKRMLFAFLFREEAVSYLELNWTRI